MKRVAASLVLPSILIVFFLPAEGWNSQVPQDRYFEMKTATFLEGRELLTESRRFRFYTSLWSIFTFAELQPFLIYDLKYLEDLDYYFPENYRPSPYWLVWIVLFMLSLIPGLHFYGAKLPRLFIMEKRQ